MQRVVFIDRDGTIIEDVGYPHERDKVRFLPRVSEAIRLLNFPRPYGRGIDYSKLRLPCILRSIRRMQGELHPSTLWSGN